MARIAAVQMTSGESVSANLVAAEAALTEAAARGAQLAVLPENFAFMGRSDAERQAVAEAPGDGPIQAGLAAWARATGLWVVGGTVPLKTADPARVRSACLVYDSRGEQVARYDKIHLFDVDIPGGQGRYRESAGTESGSDAVVVDTPAGRIGLAVCYDLRFPELFRRLVALGAEAFALPAAFTAPTGRAHWEVLVRARAIENLSYVVAAAQAGRHENGRETHGDSMVVDPWGAVLARRPTGAGVVLADVDLESLRRTRGEFPALMHRVLHG